MAFDTPLFLSEGQTVAEALRQMPPIDGHGIVITDAHGGFLGCISALRLGTALPDARLGDLLHGQLASIDADDVTDARAAFDPDKRAMQPIDIRLETSAPTLEPVPPLLTD